MPTPIPTAEPTSIRAGDSVAWLRTLDDYPATEDWVLTYTILSASAPVITLTATPSGSDHAVTLAAATTATWPAGRRTWFARVGKGAEAHTVGEGALDILPDPTALSTHDGRTHARRMLEAIEATLEGCATAAQLDVVEWEISGRKMKYDRATLIRLRNLYKIETTREDTAAGRNRGRGRIMLRM